MGARKLSILCVDDERVALTLRKLVLEDHGYEVATAGSAAEAMRVLGSRNVDLVLTDQLMPGVSGTELTKSIKQMRPSLPVVLISGVNEIPPDADSADMFISKVEGPVEMCRKISAILAKGEAASRL